MFRPMMRVGGLSALAVATALMAGAPARADGIVTIIQKGNAGVTARLDGSFGCRVDSRAAASDMEISDRCTFGASDGPHTLELTFDNGTSQTQAITVTPNGYTLALPAK